MARERPREVSIVAWASILLGAAWLLGLILVDRADALDLIAAGLGNGAAALRLRQEGLAGPVLFLAVPGFVVELALAISAIVAGFALLARRPFARRTALLVCAGAVFVEGISTGVRVFFLTTPNQPVKLIPIIVNGLVTLGALGLWGGLLLPAVDAAYAEAPEEGAVTESVGDVSHRKRVVQPGSSHGGP